MPPLLYNAARKAGENMKYNLIVKYLKGFEMALDENHEVGIKFPEYDEPLALLSTMNGEDQFIAFEFDNLSVIQSYSQLNFAIVSIPKTSADKPANRIGFKGEQ